MVRQSPTGFYAVDRGLSSSERMFASVFACYALFWSSDSLCSPTPSLLGTPVLSVVSGIRPGICRSSAPGMWGICTPLDGASSGRIGLASFSSWYTPSGMALLSFPSPYPIIVGTPG